MIYTSTFKILAAGAMGWVIGPADVIRKIVLAKQGADLQCSTFDQYVAYELETEGFLDEHIELIRKVYKERRDAMVEAFEEFMPLGTTWTVPKGGLFLWLRLPEGCDTVELFPLAVEEKVAYVPACAAHHRTQQHHAQNFSAADPDKIREGVRRLANMAKAQSDQKAGDAAYER